MSATELNAYRSIINSAVTVKSHKVFAKPEFSSYFLLACVANLKSYFCGNGKVVSTAC